MSYAAFVALVFPLTLGVRFFLRGYIAAGPAEAVWLFTWLVILGATALTRLSGRSTQPEPIRVRRPSLHSVATLAFLALYGIALARAIGIVEAFTPVVAAGRFARLVVVGVVAAVVVGRWRSKEFMSAIMLGVGAYVFVNLVGSLTGLDNQSAGAVQGGAGILTRAVAVFPFSAHPRAFGVEAGLFLSMAFVHRPTSGLRGNVLWTGSVTLGLAGVFLSDTRSALVAVAASLLLVIFWPKRFRAVPAIALLSALIALPAYVMFGNATRWVSELPGALSVVTRTQNLRELATLNSRSWIWESTWSSLSEQPWYGWIVGHGASGHVRLGAVYDYARYWPDPEAITVHNSFLQMLVDMGLFGLVSGTLLAVLALAGSVRIVRRLGDRRMLAGVTYVTILSLFEVVMYPTSPLAIYLVLVAVFADSVIRREPHHE